MSQPPLDPGTQPAAVSDRVFVSAFNSAQASGQAARGGALIIGANLLGFVVTLSSTAILARLLTPEAFGLIAMTATMTTLLMMFSDAGLTQATVQRREITYGQLTVLFWVNLAVGAVLATLCFLVAPWLAWLYDEPGLTDVTRALSVNFLLLGAAAQFTAVINRQLRFKVTAVIALIAPVVGALAALLLAWRGAGVWALVAQLVATEVVRLVATVALAGWFPGLPKRVKGVGAMLRFGGNQLLFNVIVYFVNNADRILVGAYLGPYLLGLYDRSAQMMRLPIRLIIFPLSPVMLSTLSRLQDQPDAYRRFYAGAMTKITMVSFPATVAITLLAPEIVAILLGPQWDEAVPIFALLTIGSVIAPVSRSLAWLWISQGRLREQVNWGILITVLIVPAFVVGLSWGATGVAAAWAVTQLLLHPVEIGMATSRGPVSWRLLTGALVPGAIGATVMAIALVGLREAGLVPANPFAAVAFLSACAAICLIVTYGLLPSARRPLLEAADMLATWTGLRRASAPPA